MRTHQTFTQTPLDLFGISYKTLGNTFYLYVNVDGNLFRCDSKWQDAHSWESFPIKRGYEKVGLIFIGSLYTRKIFNLGSSLSEACNPDQVIRGCQIGYRAPKDEVGAR